MKTYKVEAWALIRDGVMFRASIRRTKEEALATCKEALGHSASFLGMKAVKVSVTWSERT